jgi:hypothetical protein
MGNFKHSVGFALIAVGLITLMFVMLSAYSAWRNPSLFFDYLLFYLLVLPAFFRGLVENILFLSTSSLVLLVIIFILIDRREKRDKGFEKSKTQFN